MEDFGIVPESIIKYTLASIAVALSSLHSQHIIYRNLNPANTIIRSRGCLVLTDFSSAKKLDSAGKTSTIAGVPYYMAPEVIKQEQYTYNADVWSMGAVLYELMSGSVPFGSNKKSVMEIF